MSAHKKAPASGQLAKGALVNNHTVNTTTYTRRRAALHEAGHAISHRAHGIRVKSVKVFKDGPHWLGWTTTEKQPNVTLDTDHRDDVSVASGLMCGHMAEMLHAAPVPPGHNLDEIGRALHVLSIMMEKGELMDPYQYPRDLLERNRAALIGLADNLMLTRKISGPRLRYLLREVVP